jgi:hypothetical protein
MAALIVSPIDKPTTNSFASAGWIHWHTLLRCIGQNTRNFEHSKFMQDSCKRDEGLLAMSTLKCPRGFSVQFYSRVLALAWGIAILSFPMANSARAQSAPAPKPAPDVLVFTNGDQLTGSLVSAANGSVTFKSDMAGTVTVTWDKIKTLHSSAKFAVIQQNQKVSRKTQDTEVPQGAVAVENQQVEVTAPGAEAKNIPTKNAQYLVDQATYAKQVHGKQGWNNGWLGSATLGASLVEATQNVNTFTAALTATRTVPSVAWMNPANRTVFDVNEAYGSTSQPGTVTTKTDIFHADAEHDWYFSPKAYYLVDAAFDHNYSQGLNLQQAYGAGIGYTFIKTPKQELDLKFDAHFERQSFGYTPGVEPPVETPSLNLIGIDLGDTYMRKLAHNIVFNQSLVLTPALNHVNAFSAVFNAGLVFPVYKRFSFTVGALDNYLNDPAIGSKKNSFQFTGGLTYTF